MAALTISESRLTEESLDGTTFIQLDEILSDPYYADRNEDIETDESRTRILNSSGYLSQILFAMYNDLYVNQSEPLVSFRFEKREDKYMMLCIADQVAYFIGKIRTWLPVPVVFFKKDNATKDIIVFVHNKEKCDKLIKKEKRQ